MPVGESACRGGGVCQGQGPGNHGLLYYAMYSTHYSRTGTGTWNHCFLLCSSPISVLASLVLSCAWEEECSWFDDSDTYYCGYIELKSVSRDIPENTVELLLYENQISSIPPGVISALSVCCCCTRTRSAASHRGCSPRCPSARTWRCTRTRSAASHRGCSPRCPSAREPDQQHPAGGVLRPVRLHGPGDVREPDQQHPTGGVLRAVRLHGPGDVREPDQQHPTGGVLRPVRLHGPGDVREPDQQHPTGGDLRPVRLLLLYENQISSIPLGVFSALSVCCCCTRTRSAASHRGCSPRCPSARTWRCTRTRSAASRRG